MPLLRFDLIEGRTDDEMKTLLDAAHHAMLEAFKVPERDRYQIVHEHGELKWGTEDPTYHVTLTARIWETS